MSYLAFFQGSYDYCAFSLGGKVTLLGMSSLVMLVLAVYTANLAAILSKKYTETGVKNLEEAIDKGYTFCAERTVYETVSDVFGIQSNQFVPDPIALGGDGNPGFHCPDCNARSRVFEFMSIEPNKDTSLYCDVALITLEDLEMRHSRGEHCDKARVGDPVAIINYGFPIFDQKVEALISHLQITKNSGVLKKELNAVAPQSICSRFVSEESNALNIQQLAGIWMFVFCFAIAGIFARKFHPLTKKLDDNRTMESLIRVDQWGNLAGHEVIVKGCKFDSDEKTFENDVQPNQKYLMTKFMKSVKSTEEAAYEVSNGTKVVPVEPYRIQDDP